LIMNLLKRLGVEDKIKPIPHETMFGSTLSGIHYSLPATYQKIIDKLIKDFPHQKSNIERLFAEMKSFYDAFTAPIHSDSILESDSYRDFLIKNMNKTYKEYIDSFIDEPVLCQIFYSQWPFGGSVPSRAPVAFYVLMFIVHAIEGSHYLQNGFKTLADLLASIIIANGGEIKTKAKVCEVFAENQNVRHVTLTSGEQFTAEYFVSNISPYHLHGELINQAARNKVWLRRLSNLNPSVSAVILYLGLSTTIDDIIPDSIHFWFGDTNDSIFEKIQQNSAKEIDHLIFLKSPSKSGIQTLTIMNFLQKSYSENWKLGKRVLSEKILCKVETIFPGLRNRISLMEIGSPATFERYTENTGGAIYGFENTSSVYGEAKLPINTYLKNLFQTGHWGKPGGGIWNAMYNGYSASQLIKQNLQKKPE